MDEKQEYTKTFEERLEDLNQDIAKLKSDIASLSSDARKAQLEERLEQIKNKRQAFKAKMDGLRGASANAWKEMKQGLEAAWNELGAAYRQAAAEFKKQGPESG